MIEIKELSKNFDKPVLENVNLEIPDNTILGLVGINGAGKSTLLRMLSGIIKPTQGSVLYNGEEVYENEKVKRNIFFLPDDPYYGVNTTPKTIVEMYDVLYKIDKDSYFNYLKRFNISLKSPMHNFSKGMKRQVFISLALAIKPKYLFLDEAFDGLDPLARLTLKKELMKIQEENEMTVIISSHSLRELEDICDTFVLIDSKTIASQGNIEDKEEEYHKYQLAFNTDVTKKLFEGVEFVSYKQSKRIITIVLKEDLEATKAKFEKYNPLLLEEIPIDFEELFIIEVESRGYLNE